MPSLRDAQRGSTYVEFVLVGAFLLVPLILGLMSVGFALSRSLQVAQLTRDVGRMAVRGVDFSQQVNQDLVTGAAARPNVPALAGGLGMQGNGGNATGGVAGNGVLVLSTYTRLPSDCGCSNAGSIVLSRRIVVGNKTLFSSAFGAPGAGLVNASTGGVSNYTNDSTARAENFSSIVDLAANEIAYMVEARFVFPDLTLAGVLPNPGVFWRSVF